MTDVFPGLKQQKLGAIQKRSMSSLRRQYTGVYLSCVLLEHILYRISVNKHPILFYTNKHKLLSSVVIIITVNIGRYWMRLLCLKYLLWSILLIFGLWLTTWSLWTTNNSDKIHIISKYRALKAAPSFCSKKETSILKSNKILSIETY